MISIEIDRQAIQRLSAKLRSLSPAAQNSITRKAFSDLTIETETRLRANLMGRILHPRSQRLVGSIGSRVEQEGGDLLGIIGSGARRGGSGRVPYANIHETGGIITPKKSKYLAIPLAAAKTAGGDLRRKPRDWPNTFVAKSGAGNLIIFQRGKRGLGATALFVLKKSVTIPARHYMSRTVEEMEAKVYEIMGRSIERELAKQ